MDPRALLEEGDPRGALEALADRLSDPADREAQLLAAVAWLDLDEPRRARTALDAIGEAPLADDSDEFLRGWSEAQVAYAEGEPERALAILDALEPDGDEETADIAWWRGLCLDHLDRRRAADGAFAVAARLDPAVHPLPVPLTPEEVEELVREVGASLPAPVRGLLEEIPIVVDDLPDPSLVRARHDAVHPDTLGLYSGTALTEGSVLDGASTPSCIHLFRRNLERFATDPIDLREQVRITLLHELGHHLGYDEEGLDELGLA